MKKSLAALLGLLLCCFLAFPAFAETGTQVPDDPRYGQQWALEAIDWLPVWQQGLTGKGVKIGIIDSGAFESHEDFAGAHLQGGSFTSKGPDESQSFANDVYGHGTFVTGIIAAQPNNGKGIAGIAPDAEIYAYRAFTEKEGSVLTMLKALEQAIADGCQIVNLSMGTTASNPRLLAGIQKAQEAGILVVASVGNGNPNLTANYYPAGYEGVIGVGAVDENLERSSFSQTNETVFVTAPGQDLASLSHTDPNSYVLGSGTSYAAPIVTAMAALALEYDPELTPVEITEMLRLTAVDLGDPGYDIYYGYGLVNLQAFIQGFESHFSMHYQLQDGMLAEEVPLFYASEEGLPQLPAPMREHYDFAGWYADEEYTLPVTEIPAGTCGVQTLYAKWEICPNSPCSDAAGDGDHACDICRAENITICEDADTDHQCDECGAETGVHEPAAGAHTCGYCGETISTCLDGEDEDTCCDTCGENLLVISVQEDYLVIQNHSDTVVIVADFDAQGRLGTVQLVDTHCQWLLQGHTRVFFLSRTNAPQLPFMELDGNQTEGE